MHRLFLSFLFGILCISHSLGANSKQILPFSGNLCRTEPAKEINKFVSGLGVGIFATGDLDDAKGRLFVLISKNHSRLYAFRVSGSKEHTKLCLLIGGREVDLFAADLLEAVKKRWGKRKLRYHQPLVIRTFGGPIPYTLKNMKLKDSIIALTAYAVMPDMYNSYDEIMKQRIGGKVIELSRGEMMAIANAEISKMDSGKSKLISKNRAAHQRILKLVDHGLNVLYIVVDKTDGDFVLVSIDRAKKKVNTLATGKHFSMP